MIFIPGGGITHGQLKCTPLEAKTNYYQDKATLYIDINIYIYTVLIQLSPSSHISPPFKSEFLNKPPLSNKPPPLGLLMMIIN